MKPIVAILIPEPLKSKIISDTQIRRMESFANIRYKQYNKDDKQIPDIYKELLKEADACITSWGTGYISEDIVEVAGNLKIISHAAGTVKTLLCEKGWEKGIKVCSAAAANAISVAEHTLGLMISTLKRVYWFNNAMRENSGELIEAEKEKARALYNINIGIIGAGYIGRHVIKLLQNFNVKILLYDPFVSLDEARKLGVTKVEDLSQLVSNVDVLSLHAPRLPETHHMVNKDMLKLMKDDAIIINTARGALIDEDALIDELKKGRFTACLDVTDPEPASADSPLRKLPNVLLTPHIAGAVFNDIARMSEYAISELERYFDGKPLLYEVKIQDFSRIA